MKKETLLLVLFPLVMVFVGLFAGFYFGIYKTSVAVVGCELEKAVIAPSPIVTSSSYNEKKHELSLTVANPGSMPILLLNKTLVLKPADVKKQALLVATSLPLGITIPAYGKVELNLQLGQAGSWFVIGDVLETTLTYSLPVSNDVYALVHRFQKSNQTNKQWNIKNQLGDNKDVQKKYNDSKKNK